MTEPELKVPQEAYEAILQEIYSEQSPVGIDASKTHIMILHKLLMLERRLDQLAEKLGTQGE